jgi:hypothetical protein
VQSPQIFIAGSQALREEIGLCGFHGVGPLVTTVPFSFGTSRCCRLRRASTAAHRALIVTGSAGDHRTDLTCSLNCWLVWSGPSPATAGEVIELQHVSDKRIDGVVIARATFSGVSSGGPGPSDQPLLPNICRLVSTASVTPSMYRINDRPSPASRTGLVVAPASVQAPLFVAPPGAVNRPHQQRQMRHTHARAFVSRNGGSHRTGDRVPEQHRRGWSFALPITPGAHPWPSPDSMRHRA